MFDPSGKTVVLRWWGASCHHGGVGRINMAAGGDPEYSFRLLTISTSWGRVLVSKHYKGQGASD